MWQGDRKGLPAVNWSQYYYAKGDKEHVSSRSL